MTRITLMELADDDNEIIEFDVPHVFNGLVKEVGARWDNERKSWIIPTSWAACIRARGVFGDSLKVGPRLVTWATQTKGQMDIRLEYRDRETPKNIRPPMLKPLYPHQAAGVEFLTLSPGALLGDQPGVGKTATLLTALADTDALPALVICPASIKENWKREIDIWIPHVGNPYVIKGSAAQRAKLLAAAADDPLAIVIINFESVRGHSRLAAYGSIALSTCDSCTPGGTPGLPPGKCEKHPKELNKIGFKTVIVDECVPHDTGIKTPTGYKPISELKPGDLVVGMDHSTGFPVITNVVNVSRSPLRDLHQIDDLRITGNHPIWQTDMGLSCYDDTYGQHTEESAGKDLRVLQVLLSGEEKATEVLQQRVRVKVSLRQPTRTTYAICGNDAFDHSSTRGTGEAVSPSAWSNEPILGFRSSTEIHRGAPETGMVWVDGREWKGAYQTTEDALRVLARLDYGVCGERMGTDTELPNVLQAGSSATPSETGDRGTGSIAQIQAHSGEGSQEETFSGVTWLDDSSSDKFGDPDQSLWNIETGTGNYFANGVLVHNCHRIKDPKSKQTRAVWAVSDNKSVKHRWAATGTPVANHPGDLWSILRTIDPLAFPAKTKFLDRYCIIEHNPFGGIKIMGLRPDRREEFFRIFDPMFRRMTKERVLTSLPPKVRSIRYAEMTPKQARAYKEMETSFSANLGEDWITVGDHLTAAGRLVQLSSSFAEIIKPEETPDDPHTWKVRLIDPSNKVDAFMEILEDLGEGYPLVACAESRQLIELTSARMTKEKIPHALITGTQTQEQRVKALDDFQNGKVNVLLFTIKAGGVGLTMTRADTIVFLQRSWSMVDNIQAEDRVHRVGSERHESVHIIDIVAPDTIEVHQINKVYEKMQMAEEIVRDGA